VAFIQGQQGASNSSSSSSNASVSSSQQQQQQQQNEAHKQQSNNSMDDSTPNLTHATRVSPATVSSPSLFFALVSLARSLSRLNGEHCSIMMMLYEEEKMWVQNWLPNERTEREKKYFPFCFLRIAIFRISRCAIQFIRRFSARIISEIFIYLFIFLSVAAPLAGVVARREL
jgi:hypothetical protein